MLLTSNGYMLRDETPFLSLSLRILGSDGREDLPLTADSLTRYCYHTPPSIASECSIVILTTLYYFQNSKRSEMHR